VCGLVTINSTTNELKGVINAFGRTLGATAQGQAWCLKALHPAEPSVVCEGLPDQFCHPVVQQNFQSIFPIKCGSGATGTWSFALQIIPHPIGFAAVEITDSTQSAGPYEFLNSQVPGYGGAATHAAAMQTFVSTYKAWRLTDMSATLICDAPALSDQGTLVACQAPVSLIKHYVGGTAYEVQSSTTKYSYSANSAVYSMKTADIPVYSQMLTIPNAYVGKVKDGCYAPLALDTDWMKWRYVGDWMIMGGDLNWEMSNGYIDEVIFLPAIKGAPSEPKTKEDSKDSTMFKKNPNYTTSTEIKKDFASDPTWNPGTNGYYPFLTLRPAYGDFNSSSGEFGCAMGDPTSKMLNHTWINICAENMAVTTTFQLVIRMGIECQLAPGTTLTPQLHMSPSFDPTALEAYSAIRSQMKDAYPASYNDLGKLWNVVKSIANTVAPVLSKVPVVGPALSIAAPAIIEGVDSIVSSFKDKKASANVAKSANMVTAERQAVRDLIARQTTRRIDRKKKRKQVKQVAKQALKTVVAQEPEPQPVIMVPVNNLPKRFRVQRPKK